MEELTLKKVVALEDCATHLKSGEVKVLSTPTVLAWMEEACANLSKQFLNDNETTVGVHVELDHLLPAFVGEEVEISVVLKEKSEKKFVFDVLAKRDKDILAKASHVRVKIDKSRFLK